MDSIAVDAGQATGAQEIVRFLAAHGYKHVFGLPGSQLVPVYHALQNVDIQYVPAIHESVTVAAADGYARVNGSAVAMIYMLPGTANALANIYNAFRDETPLLILCCQQLSTARAELGAFCEGDTVPLVTPFTRLAHELSPGAPVRSWLEKAWRTALGPPGGPVFLSLPEDVLLQPAPVVQERLSTRGAPGVPDVGAVAAALRTGKRPLIVVGGQVRRRGGTPALEALAARFQIPVCFEAGMMDGLDIAPGHPQCAGSLLNGTRESEADIVLLLGTRSVSEGSPRRGPWFANASFVAQVNHDAAKLEGTRRVDWVSLSDPAAFAAALLTALEDTPPELIEARRPWAARRPPGAFPPGAYGRQMAGYARALAPLHDAMTRGWVVDESVMAVSLTVSMQTALDGRRYAGTSGASLGWGTGAAAGVALASGEPVTLIIGDGSLRFGAEGLWTISAMKLPITIAVIDNHGYGSTRFFEREFIAKQGPAARPQKPSYYNMDFRETGPDIADMVRGFGIPCRRLAPQDDLRQAVLDAWAEAANGPNCIILPAGFEDE